MRATHTDVSERRVCRVLGMARARLRRSPGATTRSPVVSEQLVTQLRALIEQHPTYGYRRLWALLRYGQGYSIKR